LEYKLTEVVVELTKKCNLSCAHCGSSCTNQEEPQELSADEWRNCISQMSEMGVEKIVFSGGEPILKEGLEEIIRHTYENGLKWGLVSNGLTLTNDVILLLKKYKPFAVGISIDGFKETHNKIRNNSNSWQSATQAILHMIEGNIQVCAVSTVNRLNYTELPRLASWLNILGISSWQLQLTMPEGRAAKGSEGGLLIDQDIFREVCITLASCRKNLPGLNIQAADCFAYAPVGLIRTDDWTGCAGGINAIGMDACGHVMPCLSLRPIRSVESVRQKSIKHLWETSPVFDFNRKFDTNNTSDVNGRCKKCFYLKACRGGCASQSYSYYGQFHNSPFCFMKTFYKNLTERSVA